MFSLQVAVLLVLVGVGLGEWQRPSFCGDRACPKFETQKIFNKGSVGVPHEYECRTYAPLTLMCLNYNSSIPHTNNEYYAFEPGRPRYDHYQRLLDYIEGNNSENLVSPLNVPIITHMYYPLVGEDIPGEVVEEDGSGDGEEEGQWIEDVSGELGAEDGTAVIKDFRICLYLDLDNPPKPNDPDIEIFQQPAIDYYVLGFSHPIFDASHFSEKLGIFTQTLKQDGVEDYLQNFDITLSYDPMLNADAYNEIWLHKI